MSTGTRTLPLVALPLLLVVTGATAQQLDLQSPVPETSRDRSRPRHDESRTRALMPQADLYPYRPPVPYQPGFIEPLSKETATRQRYLGGNYHIALHIGRGGLVGSSSKESSSW